MRATLAFLAANAPAFVATSLELESRVRSTAREAVAAGLRLDQLRADLGRIAATALGDRALLTRTAVAAMTQWARDECEQVGGPRR